MSITADSAAELITASVAAAQAQLSTDAPATAQTQAFAATFRPAGAAGAPADDFCTIWPQAKPLLTVAATLLPFVPGVGAIAGPVLTGLIKIGDQIAVEKKCA